MKRGRRSARTLAAGSPHARRVDRRRLRQPARAAMIARSGPRSVRGATATGPVLGDDVCGPTRGIRNRGGRGIGGPAAASVGTTGPISRANACGRSLSPNASARRSDFVGLVERGGFGPVRGPTGPPRARHFEGHHRRVGWTAIGLSRGLVDSPVAGSRRPILDVPPWTIPGDPQHSVWTRARWSWSPRFYRKWPVAGVPVRKTAPHSRRSGIEAHMTVEQQIQDLEQPRRAARCRSINIHEVGGPVPAASAGLA